MAPRFLILGAPYRLTRLPLTVLDQQLAHRLPEDSAPRKLFDRALGTYDYLVGRLVANPDIVQRGSDRMARLAARQQATELDKQALAARAAANDAGRDRPAARRTQGCAGPQP